MKRIFNNMASYMALFKFVIIISLITFNYSIFARSINQYDIAKACTERAMAYDAGIESYEDTLYLHGEGETITLKEKYLIKYKNHTYYVNKGYRDAKLLNLRPLSFQESDFKDMKKEEMDRKCEKDLIKYYGTEYDESKLY